MNGPTRIIAVDRDHPDDSSLEAAAALLREGDVVAFATETVYGLGADATSDCGVARIFEAKGRPSNNPVIVHLAEIDQVKRFARAWPDSAERLAQEFWPGPLTIVLPKSESISATATAGQGTVGLRVPATAVARRLIELSGKPIAAPSANRSNRISPSEARHVLKDLGGRIPMIVDSGPTSIGIESTVIDLSRDRPRLLRPGQVSLEQLTEVLGSKVEMVTATPGGPSRALLSPGMLDVHYSPTTPAYRIDWDEPLPERLETPVGFLGFRADDSNDFAVTLILDHPQIAAARLYGSLHELDERGLTFILIRLPPPDPEWLAIRDRLLRASKPWGPRPASRI